MFIDLHTLESKAAGIITNPIFMVLGGERMTGIYHHRTPYYIKGCYIKTHLPEEYERARERREQTGFLRKAISSAIDTRMDVQEIDFFFNRLKRRDLKAIEEVHSTFILSETKYHKDLVNLTKLLWTKKLYHQFVKRVNIGKNLLKTGEEPEVPVTLDILRNYMMGIYLFRLLKFNPNLNRLNEYFENSLVRRLLNDLNSKAEVLFNGDPTELADLVSEMEEDFEASYRYTQLPEDRVGVEKALDEYVKKMREIYR